MEPYPHFDSQLNDIKRMKTIVCDNFNLIHNFRCCFIFDFQIIGKIKGYEDMAREKLWLFKRYILLMAGQSFITKTNITFYILLKIR